MYRTSSLPVRNISARPLRTVGLMAIIAVMAFSLVAGSMLTLSLENGADSTEKRLGTDITLVPRGSGYAAESVLIRGEPAAFYMDSSIVNSLSGIEGISQITTQFYLATVSDSDCCDLRVQVIGFDPGSDFTIMQWIEESNGGGINPGELVVGSGIHVAEGGQIKVFGTEYPVASKLSKSGTGLDTTIFMTLDTMKSTARDAGQRGYLLTPLERVDAEISTILIKAKPGYDPGSIAEEIYSSGINVDVILSKTVISDLTQQIGSIAGHVRVFEIMLWILAAVILGVLFSLGIRERKKEFETFRMMGATRMKLTYLVLGESSIISIAGALIGTALALLIIIPLSDGIGSALDLPYLAPSLSSVLALALISAAAAFIIGTLTAMWSARGIWRSEMYSESAEGN